MSLEWCICTILQKIRHLFIVGTALKRSLSPLVPHVNHLWVQLEQELQQSEQA